MFAAAKPEPHPRMLDRFLVIAEGNDLRGAHRHQQGRSRRSTTTARERFRAYENAGYPVHYTSVKTGIGPRADLQRCAHRPPVGAHRAVRRGEVVACSTRSSRAPNLRVGAISESVNKGRHTTVGALMLPLPGGRWRLRHRHAGTSRGRPVGAAARAPRPVLSRRSARCATECRFADCRHVAEPECAVRAAVAAGTVSDARYDSYLRLLEELEAG